MIAFPYNWMTPVMRNDFAISVGQLTRKGSPGWATQPSGTNELGYNRLHQVGRAIARMAAKSGLTRVTAFGRLVIALLLLMTFVLAADLWSAQQSARSVCLLVADNSSNGLWLTDVNRGIGSTLQVPSSGGRPHLFTVTFSNSPIVVYADEDTGAAPSGLYGSPGILSAQLGPLLPRVAIGDIRFSTQNDIFNFVSLDLSPDGQHIVYTGYDANGQAFLKRVALDGSDVVTRPLAHFTRLNGWSRDGKYFNTLTFDGNGYQFNLWETSSLRVVHSFPAGDNIQVIAYGSPDSHYFAFTWQNSGQHFMSIVSLDDAQSQVYPLKLTSALTGLSWSPDSRSVFAYGTSALLDVVQGKPYDLASLDMSEDNYYAYWSADGRKIIVLVNDNSIAGKVDLWQVYSMDTAHTTTLNDILTWKSSPTDPNRAAIAWLEPDGKTAIDVMDMDGSHRTRLLDLDATLPRPFGNDTELNWSPDGAWIVIPWHNAIALTTGFTLVNADGTRGSQRYDFPDGTQWRWLQDGKALGYLLTQANGDSVGILNMATGAKQALIDGPLDVRFIATPGISDLLGVWWEANDLSPHLRAYAPDGTLAYQADGATLRAAPQDNNPNPYQAADGQLMRSPDGTLALVYSYFDFSNRNISVDSPQSMTAVVTAQNQAIRLPIENSDNTAWSRCG
jgi:Tol biopolymer transport system component